MKVLVTGCKEWPYGSSSGHENFVGGGTGKYLSHLCRGLAGAGVQVHLIVRRFPGQAAQESDGKIAVHRVRFMKGFYPRLPSFAFFSFIRGLSVARECEIIHGHGLFGCMTAAALSAVSGKPCVMTPHGLSSRQGSKFGKPLVGLLKRAERLIFSRADSVVFLSSNERDDFLEHVKIPEPEYQIIESATELPAEIAKTHNIAAEDEPKKPLTVVYVGRLVGDKGLEELVQSIPLLAEELRARIRVRLVGDGYLRAGLESLAGRLGLSQTVQFAGFQSDPGKFYSESDIFILPSAHEGFPLSLLEAMSHGLPCIINDFGVPISRDIILVMPDNRPQTIAEYVQRLADSRDYRLMLGAKGRQLIGNRYSFGRVTKEHAALYSRVLEAGE